MALKHMSQKIPGELTSAKEVADTYGTPFDATARVMQLMAQSGLLRSEQGAFGGYQITKDLAKITMWDLNNVILGPTQLAKCMATQHHNKEGICDIRPQCNIITPIHALNARLNSFYQSVSLKDLLIEIPSRAEGKRAEVTHHG